MGTGIYACYAVVYIYIVGGSFLLFGLEVCFVCCRYVYICLYVCTYVCIEQLLGVGFYFISLLLLFGGLVGRIG